MTADISFCTSALFQVFVDEFTCIGCRNCNNVCPSTFMMEEEWGRARVAQQGVDGVEKLQVGGLRGCQGRTLAHAIAPHDPPMRQQGLERRPGLLLACFVIAGLALHRGRGAGARATQYCTVLSWHHRG